LADELIRVRKLRGLIQIKAMRACRAQVTNAGSPAGFVLLPKELGQPAMKLRWRFLRRGFFFMIGADRAF
jgi:hypothetical protein